MEKTDILLRTIENLLDENARLRAELSKLKQRGMCPRTSEFLEALTSEPKYKVQRSCIVNDPTDMIKGAQELIENFEDYLKNQKESKS